MKHLTMDDNNNNNPKIVQKQRWYHSAGACMIDGQNKVKIRINRDAEAASEHAALNHALNGYLQGYKWVNYYAKRKIIAWY